MTKFGAATKKTLKEQQLAPKKRFGQNFLVHRHTAEAIVRAGGLVKSDTVVEVGVGLGALTIPLAGQVERVFGFEIDSGIIRMHQEKGDLPENVTLIHKDILKADFDELHEMIGAPLKLMANLPYSISNPFIFKLIDNYKLVDSATIMLQKEVAERLMAQPGTKEYGVPTVLLASCATVSKKMILKPDEFHPRPKIDSMVITIDFRTSGRDAEAGEPGKDYSQILLKRIVRACFNQRRKTILNTLSGLAGSMAPGDLDGGQLKSVLEKAIVAAQLEPSVRPEKLTVNDFIRLCKHLDETQLFSAADE